MTPDARTVSRPRQTDCTRIARPHECEYPPAALQAILISTSLDPHSAHLSRRRSSGMVISGSSGSRFTAALSAVSDDGVRGRVEVADSAGVGHDRLGVLDKCTVSDRWVQVQGRPAQEAGSGSTHYGMPLEQTLLPLRL